MYQSTALTPFDRELFDFGRHVRTDFGVDVAKVLTELGSFTAVTVLVAAAAVYLAAKSRPVEAVVLVLGFALIYVAVDIAKDAIDRPRPAGPLVDTSEAAFPSGHAAYATAWVAVAVAVTRHRALTIQVSVHHGRAAARGGHRPDACVPARALLVGRGRRLGASAPRSIGGLATIALVVAEVRNNERDPATSPP